MSQRDYYEVLGLEKNCTPDDVRKSYRKRAMKFHPDRNPDDPGAEDKFKEATEAYEVLKDDQKRQAYDQFGHAGVSDQGGFGGNPFGGGGGIDMEDALRSFMRDFGFDSFFGGGGGRGRQQNGPAPGRDLRVKLKLTLEEVYDGTTKQIKIQKKVACSNCGGSGRRPGSEVSRCATCGGSGEVRRVQRSILGQFVNVSPCHACNGEGVIVKDPCTNCRGEGRANDHETLNVNVPAGVSTGDYIPLRGQGEAGVRGAQAGDVMVILEVVEHDLFERMRQDLIIDMPVAFSVLALGGKVEVPTLDGAAKLKVPAGTQSHQLFRLRGKGLPHLNAHRRGDLLVRLVAWSPGRTSKEEAKLLERLLELEESKVPGPRRRS
ncbi:MAG: molecular chaperone DnaJ [bacterium]|nr:molecular chaperone DnaJ [bacterium]